MPAPTFPLFVRPWIGLTRIPTAVLVTATVLLLPAALAVWLWPHVTLQAECDHRSGNYCQNSLEALDLWRHLFAAIGLAAYGMLPSAAAARRRARGTKEPSGDVPVAYDGIVPQDVERRWARRARTAALWHIRFCLATAPFFLLTAGYLAYSSIATPSDYEPPDFVLWGLGGVSLGLTAATLWSAGAARTLGLVASPADPGTGLTTVAPERMFLPYDGGIARGADRREHDRHP